METLLVDIIVAVTIVFAVVMATWSTVNKWIGF